MVFGYIWSFLSVMVPFIGLLTVIVFFHELGHFLVGRWCGVRVEAFSIGFGREIFGWNDKHGTRWKIAWLPLGGYVKFAGDANAASMPDTTAAPEDESPDSFHAKPLWQRAAVVVAGPVANFILAIVIYTGLFSAIGVPVLPPVVDKVTVGSAAEKAGIQPGDRIVSIEGALIKSFTDIKRHISDKPGVEVKIVVERKGKELPLRVTPVETEISDGMGGKIKVGLLGIQRSSRGLVYEKKSPVQAVITAVSETWNITSASLRYVRKMLIGEASTDQLAGPIRIAQVSGQVAAVSFAALLQLGAILSISIGLINLFPIPMLDGGHLLFYLVEAIRGKPLGPKAQEIGFKLGFALVITLMLVATWNDMSRINLF